MTTGVVMTEGSAQRRQGRSAARRLRRRFAGRHRAGKPSWGGLVARALPIVLLTTGCSIGSESLSVTPVTFHTSTERAPAAELTAQARRALTDAIVATGIDYRFETTVTVDGTVTGHVVGTVSGNVARTRAAADDGFTDYVRTISGSWVVSSGHGRVTGEAAGDVAPLDVLVAPHEVGVRRGEGPDDVVLRAVYPGAAVGAPAAKHIEVDVTIRSGVVRRVVYEVPAGDDTFEVVTVIEAEPGARIPVGG